MSATVTIGRNERATLHWLMVRRLFILGQDPPELARREGVSHDELAEEFGEDLRLMADLGWEVEDDRKTVDLTMPAARLVKTIRRLRRDARRAPSEPPREREPQGDDAGRWECFREAVEVCDEVLDLLDSPHRVDAEEASATSCSATGTAFELSPVSPPAILILAAVERAARHERSDEVATATVVGHLGFEPTKKTIRLLQTRLDALRNAGSLTRAARDGGDSWVLTSEGREELDRRYEAEEVGELPEAPQHRAWREARVEAAVRLERFKDEMGTMLEEANALLEQAHPPRSSEWIAMSQRLSPAAWRVGSATHCLYEWVEPQDDPVQRVAALWEAIEFYLGDRGPNPEFTDDEIAAAIERASAGMAAAKSERVGNVLRQWLNSKSPQARLENVLAEEGVPFTDEDMHRIRRLRRSRNRALHGAESTPRNDEIDQAIGLMSRAMTTRWQT